MRANRVLTIYAELLKIKGYFVSFVRELYNDAFFDLWTETIIATAGAPIFERKL